MLTEKLEDIITDEFPILAIRDAQHIGDAGGVELDNE